MSRPYVVEQKVFDAAVLTATTALRTEFAICPTKVIEIITTGFTGTLDIKGAVGSGETKDNVAYVRLGQDNLQTPVNDQLSYTTDTGRYRYLVAEPYAYIDFVMTRSVGSVTVNVYGFAGALLYPFDGKRKRVPVHTNTTGTGTAIATLSPAANYQLLGIRIHLGSALTSAETLTVTLDANAGAAYDVVLFSRDMSVGTVLDLVIPFGGEEDFFVSGDQIVVALSANAGGDTWGCTTTHELV